MNFSHQDTTKKKYSTNTLQTGQTENLFFKSVKMLSELLMNPGVHKSCISGLVISRAARYRRRGSGAARCGAARPAPPAAAAARRGTDGIERPGT